MELIFGEGTDGDCEALILGPLARGGYIVTVEWNDPTSPEPGGEITGYTCGISNANGGEIEVQEIDERGSTIGALHTIPIHHITRLEIH